MLSFHSSRFDEDAGAAEVVDSDVRTIGVAIALRRDPDIGEVRAR